MASLIKYENKQGYHMKKKEADNMMRVYEWFKENRTGTMKDCQESTGLSHVTVRKHMRILGLK